MRTLFIVNDPPYGSERSYNALRLAASLATRENEEVWVYLMGDASAGAKSGQSVPKGFYNFEALLRLVISYGGAIAVCGTCLEARGIAEGEMVEGLQKTTLQTLTDWVQEVDRVLTY
jgi:uncharacterized protein involved in oxidation of intracellular sulfur